MRHFIHATTAEYERFYLNTHTIMRIYLDTPEEDHEWVTIHFVDGTVQSIPFATREHAIEFIEDIGGV